MGCYHTLNVVVWRTIDHAAGKDRAAVQRGHHITESEFWAWLHKGGMLVAYLPCVYDRSLAVALPNCYPLLLRYMRSLAVWLNRCKSQPNIGDPLTIKSGGSWEVCGIRVVE